MSRPVRDDKPVEVDPQESQVANHVEDLVSHALVGVAKCIADDPVAAENQEVGGGRSNADSRGAQGIGFCLQQERATGRQLVAKRVGSQSQAEALSVDRCLAAVIEVIGKRQSARRTGEGRQHGVALAYADGPFQHEGLPHPVLLDDPGVVERLDEGSARTVAPGTFTGIDLNHAVVDPQTGQGGHHMLDHLHGRRTLSDRRAALGWNHVVDVSGHDRAAGQVDPLEDDTRAGVGGMESKLNVRPVEKANPTHLRRAGERALWTRGSEHSIALSSNR